MKIFAKYQLSLDNENDDMNDLADAALLLRRHCI